MPAAPTVCLVKAQDFITLCFSLFFPLVLFERGNSLSFIYGIYGRENLFSQDHIGHKGIAEGSKSTSGLWSLVFVKALPIRTASAVRILSYSASKCLARSIIVSSPFSRSSCERPTL